MRNVTGRENLIACGQTKLRIALYQCVVVPSLECSMPDRVITSPVVYSSRVIHAQRHSNCTSCWLRCQGGRSMAAENRPN